MAFSRRPCTSHVKLACVGLALCTPLRSCVAKASRHSATDQVVLERFPSLFFANDKLMFLILLVSTHFRSWGSVARNDYTVISPPAEMCLYGELGHHHGES